MVKVVCIDDSNNLTGVMKFIEGNRTIGKLLTSGKIYDAYTSDDFEYGTHMGRQCPVDSYYMIADDGYPIFPLRKYFRVLRESNLDILLNDD